jgi:hypothetical protein
MVYHAEDFVCEGRWVGGREIVISSGHRKSRLVAMTGMADAPVSGRHEDDKTPSCSQLGLI